MRDAIPENNRVSISGGCENAIPIKDKAGDRRTLKRHYVRQLNDGNISSSEQKTEENLYNEVDLKTIKLFD